ncbi:MAG: HAD family hydrolase, partial [Oceanicaulis sp.]
MVVSDIDDTLVGERESLQAFARWRRENKGVIFAIATGRSLQDALAVLRRWDAPLPEVLITSVGSEIYFSHDLDLRHIEADPDWSVHLSDGWDREAIASALGKIPGVTPQGPT